MKAEVKHVRAIRCSLRYCGCKFNSFVWVSHVKKMVYLETPKCGCTTVKAALDIRIPLESLFLGLYYFGGGVRVSKDIFVLIKNHFGWTGLVKSPYSLFMVTVKILLKKCVTGPIGRYKFYHYYGDPSDLVRGYPHYKILFITRDAKGRIKSALNMFYDQKNTFRSQQMRDMGWANIDELDCKLLVSQLKNSPNHHCETLHAFFPLDSNFLNKNSTDISNLDFVLQSNGFPTCRRNSGNHKSKMLNSLIDLAWDDLKAIYKHECFSDQHNPDH